MEANNTTSLLIQGLEKRYAYDYPDIQKKEILKYLKKIKDGIILSQENIDFLVRLILREMVWCKLINGQSLFVHFGYDYYMYIGSSKKLDNKLESMQKFELFVEQGQSPYM